jgi:hypothetical protein
VSIAADKLNTTPSLTDHPSHHNEMATAINDVETYLLGAGDALTFTIPTGASESAVVEIGPRRLFMLIVPAGVWPTAPPVPLTFLTAPLLGGIYQPIFDGAGFELTIPAASMVNIRAISLWPFSDRLAAVRYLKLRAGNAMAPAVQAASRTLTMLTK